MPAQYVKPYVKRGKNDAADAEAICEAVTRPTKRFVPVKTPAAICKAKLPRVLLSKLASAYSSASVKVAPLFGQFFRFDKRIACRV